MICVSRRIVLFFFKPKTAYEMRISDWSSDVCSSDLVLDTCLAVQLTQAADILLADLDALLAAIQRRAYEHKLTPTIGRSHGIHAEPVTFGLKRSEEHTSELQSLMRNSYAVFCLKKKKQKPNMNRIPHPAFSNIARTKLQNKVKRPNLS